MQLGLRCLSSKRLRYLLNTTQYMKRTATSFDLSKAWKSVNIQRATQWRWSRLYIYSTSNILKWNLLHDYVLLGKNLYESTHSKTHGWITTPPVINPERTLPENAMRAKNSALISIIGKTHSTCTKNCKAGSSCFTGSSLAGRGIWNCSKAARTADLKRWDSSNRRSTLSPTLWVSSEIFCCVVLTDAAPPSPRDSVVWGNCACGIAMLRGPLSAGVAMASCRERSLSLRDYFHRISVHAIHRTNLKS